MCGVALPLEERSPLRQLCRPSAGGVLGPLCAVVQFLVRGYRINTFGLVGDGFLFLSLLLAMSMVVAVLF